MQQQAKPYTDFLNSMKSGGQSVAPSYSTTNNVVSQLLKHAHNFII